ALPPGSARLSTTPVPTGSDTLTKTTGIVWVACNRGETPESAPNTSALPERSSSAASAAIVGVHHGRIADSPRTPCYVGTFNTERQNGCRLRYFSWSS